jgi:polar amino acid transport system substrate-binding protein
LAKLYYKGNQDSYSRLPDKAHMDDKRPITKISSVMLFFFMATGCGNFPRDTEHTLQRIQQGILRVGVTHHPPFTVTDHGELSGPEIALVTEFAARHGAQVRWTISSEADLFEQLKQNELDLVVGGITTQSPYRSHAGFTQPHTRRSGKRYVLAASAGEHAFLLALDRFIIHYSQ